MKLYVKEIILATDGVIIKGNLNSEIYSISTDSRRLKGKDLFIPLIGKNYDGHIFISDALNKGAIGFIFSNDIDFRLIESAEIVIKVKDTLKALQDIASYYREKAKFKVIAITGSSGKTSTKYFIVDLFKDLIPLNFSKENYNNEIGVPLTILDTPEDIRLLVLELAMRGLGEIRILSRISKPDFALITNIGTAHIGLLGSKDNIAKAKSEIFDYLNPNGWAVLNGDDYYCRKIFKSLGDRYSKLTFGFKNHNDVKGNINYEKDKAYMNILLPDGKKIDLILPLFPLEIYQNLLGGISLLWLNFPKLSMEWFNEKINISFPKQRLNIKKGKNNSLIIDDTYNANPNSMKVAIDFLKIIKGNRKIALLGDMLELGEFSLDLHKKVIDYAIRKKIDIIFLFGDEMKKAFLSLNDRYKNYPIIFEDNLENMKKKLLNEIKEKDVILVKGSRGMCMERFIKDIEDET